jgi:hypothetical protein
MLVTSFSQAYPKRPFTTTLANGRIGVESGNTISSRLNDASAPRADVQAASPLGSAIGCLNYRSHSLCGFDSGARTAHKM